MKKILKKYIGGVKLIHTYIHTGLTPIWKREEGCCLKIVTLLSIGREVRLNSFTSFREVAS